MADSEKMVGSPLSGPGPSESPSVDRVPVRRRHPSWIKTRFMAGERYHFLAKVLREKGLHTVCEEAQCPNIGECWSHGTATFMLMGDTCTRACTFCAVGKGKPVQLDVSEPEHVAEVIETTSKSPGAGDPDRPERHPGALRGRLATRSRDVPAAARAGRRTVRSG